MAIDRILNKLSSFVGMELNASKVRFAVENWEHPSFPRTLETQIRRWMKEHGNEARNAGTIVAYAKVDEQSAKWLVNPIAAAQDAILHFKDEDDTAALVSHAVHFDEISPRMWKAVVAGIEALSPRVVAKLAAREDAPRTFVRQFGEAVEEKPARTSRRAPAVAEKPVRAARRTADKEAPVRARRPRTAADDVDAPVVRRTRKLVEKEAPTRGRTGRAVTVERVKAVKPRIQKVKPDYDLDDDAPAPARTSRRTATTTSTPAKVVKTVKKTSVPDKKVVSRRTSSKASDEAPVNERRVSKSVRSVRRPTV